MRGFTFASRSVTGALFVACALFAPVLLPAQTPTGTVRGTVTDEGGEPLAGASVTARNFDTNLTREMLTGNGGFYNLGGLPSGNYEITYAHPSYAAQSQQVVVQIGQSLTIDVELTTQAIEVQGIVAVFEAERIIETTTPEVATNITQAQIENLPQLNRNFLDFAQLVPGVSPSVGGTSITAGGVDPEQINLFIDGASFKNNVLQGGVAGQDASDGNPFPQNAVDEFRVITQNYKAEYQKATGAVITATTKSGTNQWEGDAFFFGQNEDFIAKDEFQSCEGPNQDENCVDQDVRNVGRKQFGGSLGGPIIQDELFVFGSYEGNYRDLNERVRDVPSTDLARVPAAVAQELQAVSGREFSRPLRSNLFFGKLTWQAADRHLVDGSVSIRDEYEERNFGDFQARSRAEDFNNDVATVVGRWQYSSGPLLNEAHVDWQRYHWNPIPLVDEVGRIYEGILDLGGRSTEQDFEQKRINFQDDVSYTVPDWNGAHVFKAGTYLAFYDYHVVKFQDGNPQFFFRQDENFTIPYRAILGVGDPDISSDNTQFGLYVQDDWNVNDRLMLNLGLRWDVETNMLNNEWVTPDSVREDAEAFLTPEQQARYFTDGDDRDVYLGAIQPRLGFTYDVTGGQTTYLFGGFGIYHDRTIYNYGLDERFRLQFPVYQFRFSATGAPDPQGNPTNRWDPSLLSREGLLGLTRGNPINRPEAFLLDNETRPPKAYQYSVGVRHVFGDAITASANYTGVRGHNEFTWLFGTRRPNGQCCLPAGERFGNFLISDDSGRTWYDALMLQLGRSFSEEAGWGAQFSYTLSRSEQENFGFFTLDIVSPTQLFERHPSDHDERHRFVGNAIVGLPWDFLWSTIVTFASARPISAFVGGDPDNDGLGPDWPPGETRNSRRGDDGAFRQVDMRLEKRFVFGTHGVGVIVDVFNVLDTANYGCFEQFFGDFNRTTGQISENPNYGRPCGLTGIADATSRRIQLGVDYDF
jgi:hypothetical protein